MIIIFFSKTSPQTDTHDALEHRYFRCFLTALSMFSGSLVGAGDEEIQHLVTRASEDVRDLVFEDLDLAGDDLISFEEFGTWYTEEGFRVVPWLELLDLRKWKDEK